MGHGRQETFGKWLLVGFSDELKAQCYSYLSSGVIYELCNGAVKTGRK
jgi:hypothetical protein